MPDPNSHHPDMFRHDETVGLRLELARVKDQRDSFQAALRKEVLAVVKEALADNASLKAEVERLTERNKFLEQIDSYLQGANEHSFEQRCNELEAEVEQLKEGNDCLGQMHDKEMERSAYLLEEFNRTTAWGRGLESDLSHARVEISFLKSEVERLRKAGDYLADHLAHEFGTCPSIEIWLAAKEGKQ